MPNDYPVAFNHADFPAIAAHVAPAEDESQDQEARIKPLDPSESSSKGSATLRPKKKGKPVAFRLSIVDHPADATRCSQPFNNHSRRNDAVHGHFQLVPGVDACVIAWKIKNPRHVARMTFEVFAANHPAALWMHDIQHGAHIVATTAAFSDFTGSRAFSDIAIPANTAIGADPNAFPNRIPTVEYAPYQVRLSVYDSDGGPPTVAWTYFDIVVADVTLDWGAPAMIPAAPPADVTAPNHAFVAAQEPQIFGSLTAAGPPTANHEVRLLSNMFSQNANHMNQDVAFTRYKDLWGAGPRIPILGRIRLLTAAGAPTNGAPTALGKVKLLWDWEDTRANHRAAMTALLPTQAARRFVRDAQHNQRNVAGLPRPSHNCHASRGGKRASARPQDHVFPDQVPSAAFPYTVQACPTRTWAAFSTAHVDGTTGVLFQPSRMALDVYRLTVYLAKVPAYVDRLDPSAQLLADNAAVPKARSGWFEVLRKINATYVRKSAAVGALPKAAIEAHYRQAGIVIDWLPDQVISQVQFNASYNNALFPPLPPAPLGAPAPAPPAPAFPVTAIYPGVDPYTGAVMGGGPTGFVLLFLSWADFARPHRAQAVQTYMHATWQRRARYNLFTAAHPLMNAVDRRIALYATLNAAERLLVDQQMQQDLMNAGLPDTPQDYHEQLQAFAMDRVFAPVCNDRFRADAANPGVNFYHVDNPFATQTVGGAPVPYAALDGAAMSQFNVTGSKALSYLAGPAAGIPGQPLTVDVAAHELAHALYLPHAPPLMMGQGAYPTYHDATDNDCNMNYNQNNRHFCGFCLLRLRGWSAATLSNQRANNRV